ncbi:mechanosensitive ion channel family protein [Pseudophaeobacter sp.]|uniref:mechanosensitive ion channel family protein n=1 Tax=Pseudophaeobacter sp. TaxID=1971739 RepID=UPI003299F087
MSKWGIKALQGLLNQFSVTISEVVAIELRSAVEILVVTLSLYFVLEIFAPPELFGNFGRRILASVAVVAVFGAWFQLSGPFASMLRDKRVKDFRVEIDWVQKVTQFAILLFGLTALLEVWEVDIGGALTGVGVLGAGLAIATQDLIRNLVAGMSNISEKRFETGDAIEVEGQFVGTVRRIDLRSTLVVGFDQIPRHIPNSDLANSVVLNYSSRTRRRVKLSVGLVLSSTQAQIEAVRDGLIKYHRASGDFDLSEDAAKHIYVNAISTSSVDILIYVWTTGPDYQDYLAVLDRLLLAVLRITQEAGTTLAYPTRTVHLGHDVTGSSDDNGKDPL